MTMDRRTLLATGGASLLLAGGTDNRRLLAAAPSMTLDKAALDALVYPFMKRFEVPGIAVAVLSPGKPPLTGGYGFRALGLPDRVDVHTRFAIASNSKAFTSAALAILVDEGKLGWDQPVISYLPEFQLYDPVVTKMMTVRDLLIHNSGLPLGAGDLMSFPTTTHSLDDILHGLRYLKPVSGFRTTYAYDNNLYLVAGMVLSRVTGKSWEQFVSERLLQPLGMTESVAGFSALKGGNIAGRHARLGPPLRGMGAMKRIITNDQDKIDAAGGINTSVHDAVAWLNVQLAKGRLPNDARLWSEAQAQEMWRPRTITASGPGPDDTMPQRSVLRAYALGWEVLQYRDQRLLVHNGALGGQTTTHALLPELGCAVAVYSNEEGGYAVGGLRNALLDRLIGAQVFDWVSATFARQEESQADALKETGGQAPQKPAGGPTLPLSAYAGRYHDRWYGDIVVTHKGRSLAIDFLPTLEFKGALEPWGTDSFRTHFAAQDAEDAVVTFIVDDSKVTRVTMKALSPLADFSFDFQDMDFAPVDGELAVR